MGIFPIPIAIGRDSGFASKIGIIPTKSGWLDSLTVLIHTAGGAIRLAYRLNIVK